ncbi:hypothetical protein MGG_03621 [Pyricularia oryzae 70-15]|uniref:Uncharacterized protein n=3 Tax=Pyricularia oryzae TaxID=318829 RepID=G4N739_PYRO7|nr:uncharacterized protein MGG_03621 [Pyricularia oryzae 70-15]EHA49952.1 hypothetical protein MGG_03621 [Pyricularia oryzae 70-15]ELQ36569.1 hypothetical protein OOU_Y34scaffold00654g25 [Pyricularia oryzae Y34]KAI7918813.1 hypothetical protein M0657_007415 [Pyricularia oryzae]KAI7919950.1 hypothetical protein M9X92_006110 [Pyricularia oryzae]
MPSAVRLVQALLLLLTSSNGALAVEQTAAWVSVDDSGAPKTLTPVLSTANGLPTIVSNAAPHEITATVFTRTQHGYISTSTGSPSVYSAMSGGSNGQGAFPLCKAAAEAKTPLCLPKDGSILNPGITYYVTWDPTFLKNATNTTVTITTTYYNMTTALLVNETITPSSTDELAIPFSRGFYAWPVGWQILQPGRPEMNVTLTLTTTTRHLNTTIVAEHHGPVVLVEKEKSFRQPDTPTPAGPEIYIGLPVILGFVLLMVFGTCVWNRNARRIDLGALVARSRRGRSERGRGRYQRLGGDDNDDDDDGNVGGRGGRSGRRQRKESIRLMEYDEGEEMESGRFGRRDSVDSLGSLAGSPVRQTRKRHGD